ncbi:actin depolymerizing factor, putative [Eimeria necatrix]|uniref:Actin depolymerizing factor n=2 Tax=Eimeria TaxID=5800 RepID=A2TEQ1_EIMTE|nr:actin depolymerizing factor [Eimeria tenella]XP_013435934.1 actin depolymerizing factor, putative [Eimeria necatrix]ABM89551.1 actin depolymerizing factor [Eimeria tenella]ABY64746.1 actin depolymerizing factor [Eimeria tenella]CDJ45347.1 actin depolymerizing factor [Eimeria tenella]CDJ67467.1 actin depolymerizing factor, putative [Eimeria necatrix]|eukprot:XP_013236093.1 actin depolymerizing factor [Eimeria tenella]
MASGMPVNESCVTTFNELKLRHSFKWIIFKIDHDEIVVEKKGTGDASTLTKELPASDCRYAVYDEGQRIHFILWSPDCAPVKPRMIYSSSKDALAKKLEGTVATTLEAHELGDLSVLH